ncbi:MAG: HlyD family efflux transporter periplasmic adaptor subunit [Pirellulales bacterium]
MTACKWLLMAAALLAGQAEAPRRAAQSPGGEAVMPLCYVSLIDTVKVPAQEAGVLVSLEAREGMQVEEGMVLGQVNASKAEHVKRVADAEKRVAEEQAENKVNIRFSEAAAGVAEWEYKANVDANKKSRNAVAHAEINRLKLQWKKAELQIEQAQVEQKIAELTAEAKGAEVDAAEDDIQRRKIVAPISGEVVEVLPHAGEWVNPGDPVLHIVRLDKLRIEGRLKVVEFAPGEIINRPVKVEVALARGRVEVFEGKVTFIHPTVVGGYYRVRAEVVNRSENGQWLLRDGHEVVMTVQTGAVASRPVAAQR